jgi:hypothetical protein
MKSKVNCSSENQFCVIFCLNDVTETKVQMKHKSKQHRKGQRKKSNEFAIIENMKKLEKDAGMQFFCFGFQRFRLDSLISDIENDAMSHATSGKCFSIVLLIAVTFPKMKHIFVQDLKWFSVAL